MIKHIWTIICKESIISKDDNSLSINRVLEGLNVDIDNKKVNKDNFKANIPINYEILSYFIRTKDFSNVEKAKVKISIIDPKLNKITDFDKEIEFKEGVKRLRSRIKTKGFPVSISGFYVFLINLKTQDDKDYENVAQIPIEIKIN